MQIFKKHLLVISRGLGKMPSLGYALIYLALIPVFASIYYSLPKHFYHATVQYEKTIDVDANIILAELDNEIRGHFRQAYKNQEPPFKDWKVRYNLSRLLRVNHDNVSFVLDFSLVSYGAHSFSAIPFNAIASFSWENDFVSNSNNGGGIHIKRITIEGLPDYFYSPSYSPSPNSLDVNEISRLLFPFDYKDIAPNVILMPLSQNLNNRIAEFANSVQGIPENLSGNYIRMFYLSAATITTLGYGDIVPITTKARLLVSIEAILGIVIIGLFLNALAYERNASETYP